MPEDLNILLQTLPCNLKDCSLQEKRYRQEEQRQDRQGEDDTLMQIDGDTKWGCCNKRQTDRQDEYTNKMNRDKETDNLEVTEEIRDRHAHKDTDEKKAMQN